VAKLSKNPLAFALNHLHDTMRRNGDYTFTKSRRNPEGTRMLLMTHPDIGLKERTSDLDGDVCSLFLHVPSGTMILLREWTCPDNVDCDVHHGDYAVNALTMDGLTTVLNILDNDTETLEEFVETCRGYERGEFDADDYE